MSITDYLVAGRAKLAVPGTWVRNAGDALKSTCCIITSISWLAPHRTFDLIRESILELHPETVNSDGSVSIVTFNDVLAKDLDEVLAVMDLAIEKSKKPVTESISSED